MSRKPISRLLIAAATLWLGGCGTFLNMSSEYGNGEKRVYGGVRLDCAMTWAALTYTPESGTHNDATLELIPDLPFSAIGDTLTLPITIPHSIRRCFTANLSETPER